MLEGLTHVVSRMDWYLDLANVLLADKWKNSDTFAKLRGNIQQRIVQLYASLLDFEMKSVAYCFNDHPVVKSLKTMAGFSDWKGHREVVENQETSLSKDLARYATQEVIQHLRGLSISAEKLPDIARDLGLIAEHYNSRKKDEALRQQAEKQAKRNHLIGQFKTTLYEERMKFNPERVPRTCEWFRKHDKFTEWQSRANGLLLVSADPGCGKSVLARYLIEEVLPGPKTTVSYYFFKDNPEQRKLANALCALLHSILSDNGDLIDACEDMIAIAGANLYSDPIALWKIFVQVVQLGSQARQILCVLDALDECDPNEFRTLMGLLRRSWFSSPATIQEGRVKLLFTTRGHRQIVDQFSADHFGCIHLSGDSTEDKRQIQAEIKLVIDQRLTQLAVDKRLTPERRDFIRRAFGQSAAKQLTYLWVKLAFEVLERNFEDTPTAWEALITRPPATIYQAYEKLLGGVQADAAEQVKLLFNIIIAAERPLTLMEMNLAIHVRDKLGKADSEFDLKLATDENFQGWLIQTCSFFVTVYDDGIFFLHQTAKEFLLRKEPNEPHESRWQGSFTTREAHQRLAESCIAYLSLDVFASHSFKRYVSDAFQKDEEFWDRPTIVSPSSGYSSFFDYAVRFWPDHFHYAQDFKGAVVRDIDARFDEAYFALFADARPFSRPWLVMALAVWGKYDLRGTYELIEPVEAGGKFQCVPSLSVAGVAALFGHFRLLQRFFSLHLDEASRGDNAPSGDEPATQGYWGEIPDIRHQPLFFAAATGRLECLRYILSQNGEVDATDFAHRTPLLLAAKSRQYLAADLLIASGANVNAADENGNPVLFNMLDTAYELAEFDWSNPDESLAPEGLRETGHKYMESLRRLVARGAKYDDKGRRQKDSGMLLHFTAKNNLESSMFDEIKALMQKLQRQRSNLTDFAADVSQSKLLESAYKRSLVKFLVEHGEDVNYRDGYGATPLYCACVKEHLLWNALFLLRAGADVEAETNSGYRPLQIASYTGNASTVAILLEHGADIAARGSGGRTPLHEAGSVEVCQMILRALKITDTTSSLLVMNKANASIEDEAPGGLLDTVGIIDVRDDYGQTPLHVVCSWEDDERPPKVDVARLLLENGADAGAMDEKGRTPLAIVSIAGRGDSERHKLLLPLVQLLGVYLGMPDVDDEAKARLD